MKRYRCTVAYSGAAYCGWQSQTRGDSVQEQIESALERITGQKTNILAAGRTDAGVNARGQVFQFDTELEMNERKWQGAINGYLPSDIHIMDVEDAGMLFHARYCVRAKQYDYRINMGPYDVFSRDSAYQCPYPLDVEQMKQASLCLLGTHDFTSFNSTPLSIEPDQVRTIYFITFHQEKEMLTISYYGRGFLRYMVRMLTAALLEVGRGRLQPEAVRELLDARSKTVSHHNAKPQGLTLMRVDYFELIAASDHIVVREYLPEDVLPDGCTLQQMEQAVKDRQYPMMYAVADRHTKVLYGTYAIQKNPEGIEGILSVQEDADQIEMKQIQNQLEEQIQSSGGVFRIAKPL
ncbi:MAG: tRNA pseudouridine(38-40) synthase TruA [Solobacterium sp.]|jgi:tRNA pseudouridine38-40 synthase|nr:tRNA pseudouridine(38-40) synthase TruA [Solobacterium sp.]MCH4222560.1 tRNA pseudouridine(38-40) synthase TruA [Solobacterium sp.]MCH4265411.1 tRNA pseudouridine(38-40) synthase TruA [Solobacterium sp.]